MYDKIRYNISFVKEYANKFQPEKNVLFKNL